MMKSAFRFLLSTALLGPVVIPASAEQVLFQSGTLGKTGVVPTPETPASNINEFVFSGARFELTQPAATTGIGGHFVSGSGGGGSFFGALIGLSGPDDLPDTRDLTSPDVLGTTLLAFPDLSADTYGQLELELSPGWYAIVFGSGLFGATGSGAAMRNNVDVPGVEVISRQTGPFGVLPPLAASGRRYVLTGILIPEPGSVFMFLIVAFTIPHSRVRRHRL